MKILMIASDLSLVGGAERVIVNLSNALCQETSSDGSLMQVDILTIAFSNGYIPWQLKNDIGLLRYTYFAHKDDIKALPFIKRFFVKAKFILFYKPKFFIKKRRILKTSEILENLVQGWINKFFAKHYKKYDIIIDQSGGVNYVPNKHSSDTKFIRLWHTPLLIYEKHFVNKQPPNSDKYDVWVHLTQTGAKIWSNHKFIRVIPNFLPHIPQHSANPAQKVVLSVGRMDKGDQKGFSRLLDIWQLLARDEDFESEFKQWRLIIVGDGVLKPDLERKVREFALTNVLFKPFTKDIESEYLSASIYAMSSHFEGFPMVLLEACACALPCIAFDVKTGPSDIIVHENSGFLVADNDLSGFANALKILMSDENLRAEFGKNAKKIVGEKFSKDAVLKLWQGVLGE